MEGNKKKNKSRAILVFGAPGSGKTTFAQKFAEKYNLAYYDLKEICDEYDITPALALNIVSLITRTRQSIIIEGLLDTEKERTEIRNVLRAAGYTPALVWIQTDFSTLRLRLKSKHHSVAKAKDIYDKAVAEMESPADFEKPIILSGKHTFETQTRHTLAGLAELDETKW